MSVTPTEDDTSAATGSITVLIEQAHTYRAALEQQSHSSQPQGADDRLTELHTAIGRLVRAALTVADIAEATIGSIDAFADSSQQDENLRLDQKSRFRNLRDANEGLIIATLRAQELERVAEVLERERAQLLEAEQSARTEAESANRIKDEFLATLSHELRTPITVIVGWSRVLLQKHGRANEDLTKGLNLIINNAMAQSHIIADLLDMSSIVSGKTILTVKPIDLKDCVVHSVTAQQVAAKDKGIELTVEEDGDGPQVVLGDVGRLQQVFSNLLTNALKFTPAGGRVTVRTLFVGDTYEVSVEDTGEGISADFLPQVFGRFRQASDESSALKHGGLGLGLAIVKQLVEMHGGSVRAESEGRGHGARFTIALPSRTVAYPKVSDAFDAPELALDSLSGTSVLVVEDNAAMLEFLIRILEERGALAIGVRTAGAALEALRASQALTFNVLVSDIGLPDLNGYALIRQIRRELNLTPAQLGAVAVTAFGRKEDRQHALDAGFQSHLSKPYEVSQLVAIVRELSRRTGSSAKP